MRQRDAAPECARCERKLEAGANGVVVDDEVVCEVCAVVLARLAPRRRP